MSLLDPVRVGHVSDHSFLAGPLTPGSTVVDLGVNTGEFTEAMVRDYGCSVVGVEPEPRLFAALKPQAGVTVEPLAIAGDDQQPQTLYLSESIYAATTDTRLAEADALTVEVQTITLAALLDRYELDRVPLVKVDIEGAELAMLQTASTETLRRVDQFTIEFHDFIQPTQADDVVAAKQRLRSAGFTEMMFSTNNSDVLYVNPARVPFSAGHRLAAAALYKYPRGIRRNLLRRVDNRRRARRTAEAGATL